MIVGAADYPPLLGSVIVDVFEDNFAEVCRETASFITEHHTAEKNSFTFWVFK
jgi:hypothetical protein